MENPINQEDTETNTKEPVKAEEPAASNSGERSDGTTSPPPNCSICLGKLINTSFTDSCLHQFCFTCLLQWSRIKTECPLCKQTFKSIIHNVRSEEDYDQYHVPREAHLSTQATGSFGVTLALSNAYHRFAYRTTMTPSRRYGRLYPSLQPNSSHHTRQEPPPVSIPHPPTVSSQERRQRRNIYRTGEWSDPVSDLYSRFRQCSAEYYRRYPQEISRLVPWINRDLQTIFNPEQTPIAYVLNRITSLLQRYDMRSTEFRNEIRPLLQLETDHFIHELMNYASTDLSMAAYDDTVTYYNSFPTHGLSGTGYWHHVQSQTSSSTSSTISDDSDIRVVDHVDPTGSEVPSVGPHLINLPGPSTVSQVLQLQIPEVRPFVLTITSSSSESECEIVGYVKPRCERTPEIIELMSSGEEEIVAACSNSVPDLESPRSPSLSPINDQPSTSESSRRLTKNSKSKTNTRQLDRLSLGSSESSSESDSDFENSQTKKSANRRNLKHSTKVSKTSKSVRKSSAKKNDVTKKRSKHSYSSSDSPTPRESKCRRTSLNSSRKTSRAYILSSESDDDQSSSHNNDKPKTIDKDDKAKITCRVRVRKDLINSNKKRRKRKTRRSSSSSSDSSSSSSESDTSKSSLDTTSTSLTTSSSYKYKVNKSRKKKRSKSKRSSKHKSMLDNSHSRHNRSRSKSRSRSRSRSISKSRSETRSRSRSREELSDVSERCSVNERYRERKAAKIANKRLKNKHLYVMTDSQNDEDTYRSNSQCSDISDRYKTSKSNEKKYSKGDSNSKAKSHKTKSHKKSSKTVKKQKRVKTRGETEKRSRRRITSSSSSSSSSSFSSSSSKY